MQRANPLLIQPMPATVAPLIATRAAVQAPHTLTSWVVLAMLAGVCLFIWHDRRAARQQQQVADVIKAGDAVIQPAIAGNATLGAASGA